MAEKTVLKMRVESIERINAYGGEAVNLKLQAVYSNDPNSENYKFWKATPSGTLNLSVINTEAAAFFELGKEYILEATRAAEPAGE